ncbi:unnamed protein product [Amoebophrya sp. A25]|nr:unnamed protein product [Amoebophrya sp. A25]|eukprot:GSA25T00019527001.1
MPLLEPRDARPYIDFKHSNHLFRVLLPQKIPRNIPWERTFFDNPVLSRLYVYDNSCCQCITSIAFIKAMITWWAKESSLKDHQARLCDHLVMKKERLIPPGPLTSDTLHGLPCTQNDPPTYFSDEHSDYFASSPHDDEACTSDLSSCEQDIDDFDVLDSDYYAILHDDPNLHDARSSPPLPFPSDSDSESNCPSSSSSSSSLYNKSKECASDHISSPGPSNFLQDPKSNSQDQNTFTHNPDSLYPHPECYLPIYEESKSKTLSSEQTKLLGKINLIKSQHPTNILYNPDKQQPYNKIHPQQSFDPEDYEFLSAEDQKKKSIFERVNLTAEEIERQIKDILTTKNLQHLINKKSPIPHYYNSSKEHKAPKISSRGITGAPAHTTLGKCASELHSILKCVLEWLLKYQWQGRTFKIINTQDLVKKATKSKSYRKNFYGFDFGSMYDRLPHHLILSCLNKVITDVYSDKKNEGKVITSSYTYNNNKWIKAFAFRDEAEILRTAERLKRDPPIYYKLEQVLDIVDICINSNYISCLDTFFIQRIGIPQGLSCSPMIADIFCCYYEYIFCLKFPIFGSLGICRYMDDLLAPLDIPVLGIYPKELEILRTTTASSTACFLDVELAIINHELEYKVYDKRRSFDFPLLKYTPFSSCVPASSHKHHFKSAAIRLYNLNSFLIFYLFDLLDVTSYFVHNQSWNKNIPYCGMSHIVLKHYQHKWFKTPEQFKSNVSKFLVIAAQELQERFSHSVLRKEEPTA